LVTGESGDTWSVIRECGSWRLYIGEAVSPSARVELVQDDSWRLVTKGITPAVAETHSRLSGDLEFARHLLTTVAIIE
jgi:hypothetical protein